MPEKLIISELKKRFGKTSTQRGRRRDMSLKARKNRILNPNVPADLERINRLKNVFKKYDVVGVDFRKDSRGVGDGAGRPKKSKPANALQMSNKLGKRTSLVKRKKTRHKYNYPKHFLKKDGTIKKAFRRKAAKFRADNPK